MAAVLRVQNTASGSGVTSANCSLVGVQAGDRLIVLVRERDGGSISSVTSDLDGALTQDVQRAATAAQAAIYDRPNATAGTHVITVTFGANRTFDFNASAWSGLATTGNADTTGNAGNSGTTSHNNGNITPSGVSLLITCLGIGGDSGGATPPAGFTALNVDAGATSNRQAYAYQVSFSGTLNPVTTTINSTSSDGVDAAFIEAAPAGLPTGISTWAQPRQRVTFPPPATGTRLALTAAPAARPVGMTATTPPVLARRVVAPTTTFWYVIDDNLPPGRPRYALPAPRPVRAALSWVQQAWIALTYVVPSLPPGRAAMTLPARRTFRVGWVTQARLALTTLVPMPFRALPWAQTFRRRFPALSWFLTRTTPVTPPPSGPLYISITVAEAWPSTTIEGDWPSTIDVAFRPY